VSLLSGDRGLDRSGCHVYRRCDRTGNQESCNGQGREEHFDKHIIEGGSTWLAR